MKLYQRLGQRYRFLAQGPLGPIFVFGWRLRGASVSLARYSWLLGKWLFNSRETTNLTYEITDRNVIYTCEALAVALRCPPEEIRQYADEVLSDKDLADHVITRSKTGPGRNVADAAFRIGRRVGWYAIVRALKPRVVVETGVDKGLGSVVLCAALLRNKEEGSEGRYYGTEIKPEGGYLLSGRYATVGTILYGDSIKSLQAFDGFIDVFINDSDHSADYEAAEYRAIRHKLSGHAVLIGDNAHCTEKLWEFSREIGWSFLFIKEEPKGHFYSGAGIGLCFAPPTTTINE